MLLTRAPVAGREGRSLLPVAPRLACVKPAASVHPEPGSNSPLLFIFSDLFFYFCLSVRLSVHFSGLTVKDILLSLTLFAAPACTIIPCGITSMPVLWHHFIVLCDLSPAAGFHPRFRGDSGCKITANSSRRQIF